MPDSPLHWARMSDNAPGETECGDIVACLHSHAGTGLPASWLVVIDGLGHGAPAALAARRALAEIQAALAGGPGATPIGIDPAALLRRLDAALAGTRGAAVGLAGLAGGQLWHAGIGNTRALRWRDGQVLRLPSRWGIVGDGQLSQPGADAQLPVQQIDLRTGDWLLLFTDGLDERLQIPQIRPEWQADPQRLCQHLLAHWRHPRDDAAVLACRVLA